MILSPSGFQPERIFMKEKEINAPCGELWKSYALYSQNPDEAVECISASVDECKKIPLALDDVTELLIADVSTEDGEYLSPKKYAVGLGVSLLRLWDRSFLCDNGYLSKMLDTDAELYKELVRIIDTDYDLTLINGELCSEVSSADELIDCYRNFANVVAKATCVISVRTNKYA